MKNYTLSGLFIIALSVISAPATAANYIIDTQGAHASITFKIKHLGYSWLTGRINQFEGEFNYDENKISSSKIKVIIDLSSIDTNHAEREKHIKSEKYLDAKAFSKVTFNSTRVIDKGNNKLEISGDLVLHGIKKSIVIDAVKIGGGDDPWGGYRVGFEGKTTFKLKDFGYTFDLGPASQQVELTLNIEGIRQ
ncbi:Protein yceI precursor [hydrothermal vent metagenome]|uniref:Protein yceI n=1 Tax=hydrothermal vent metagenome TaxID=652676 RepID=A0A3B0W4Y7_9ZZZZ